MEDIDVQVVARKSVQGIAALVSRTFLVQLLSIASNFILTLYLEPSMFGVFFVVSAINMFLAYFQDIGLAALIIQKKSEPTLAELRTTFTIQQVLVLTIIVLTLFLIPQIQTIFHLSQEGIYVLYAYLASFFLSSLKTIPTVLLERRLDFQKLVIPQIVENATYSICLIIFAVNGFGINTFTIAILARSIIGLPIIYALQSWPIGFAFQKHIFKDLVSLGSPFQANSILALVKDDLLNLYIGATLPLTQVGYIGFGQKWAFMPLRLVMDNVIKVTFPAYSRLQHDKEALRLVVEKALFLTALFIFPIVVGFILFSPYFVSYIPKYQKWEPALFSLAFFSLNALFASISVPLTNFLNAIGKVKTTLKFMVGWTILTWVLTPLFITLFGYNGVAVASFLVAASVLIILIPVKKHLSFSFTKPIKTPLFAALCMAVFVFLIQGMVNSFLSLGVAIGMSSIVYGVVMLLFAKEEAKKTWRFVRTSLRK